MGATATSDLRGTQRFLTPEEQGQGGMPAARARRTLGDLLEGLPLPHA